MTKKPREALELWCAGQTHGQIATAMGIEVTSVTKYLWRARDELGAVTLAEACNKIRDASWHVSPGSRLCWATPETDWIFRELGLPIRCVAQHGPGWRIQDIVTTSSTSDAFIPARIQPLIPRLIQEIRDNRPFAYNSSIAWAQAISPFDQHGSSPLRMEFGGVDYLTAHALSANMDRLGLLPDQQTIRGVYLEECRGTHDQFPASLGVNLSFLTEDGNLLIRKRSVGPYIFPGHYAISSAGYLIVKAPPEHTEWETDLNPRTRLPDVFKAACRQAFQEAVLRVRPEDIEFYLITLNLKYSYLDLFGIVKLSPWNTFGKNYAGHELARVWPGSSQIDYFEAMNFTVQGAKDSFSRSWVWEDKVAVVYALIRELRRRGDSMPERTVLEALSQV